jgi:translation initiation factor IF-2
MIDQQDSTEFVEAFVAAVRPTEPRSRPGWWMLMVAIGAVFAVSLASLLNGAIRGSGTVAAATTLDAVAGPGCGNVATSFTKVGYYTGTAMKADDWTTAKTGGYRGSGCTGAFVSLPLSGHPDAYDSGRYALWTFHLGAGLEKGASCMMWQYIPDVNKLSVVGGNPAHYFVYQGAYATGFTGKVIGDFELDQVKDRGKWVQAGGFSVTGPVASVRLVDVGSSPGARAVAAQMRLECSAK